MISYFYVLVVLFSIPLGFISAQGIVNIRDFLRSRRGN